MAFAERKVAVKLARVSTMTRAAQAKEPELYPSFVGPPASR